jgi:hypothetical protein
MGAAKARGGPGSAVPATPVRRDPRRLALYGVLVVVAVGVLVAAGLIYWSFLTRSTPATADIQELEALRSKLTAVRGALEPIAIAFTSETPTAPIDVNSYRDRIAAAQKVVTSVNDVTVTSPDALEVRDNIITGGTQVLDGMSAALDALASDNTTAADEAGTQVEVGLTTLDDAKTRLDELLGTPSSS